MTKYKKYTSINFDGRNNYQIDYYGFGEDNISNFCYDCEKNDYLWSRLFDCETGEKVDIYRKKEINLSDKLDKFNREFCETYGYTKNTIPILNKLSELFLQYIVEHQDEISFKDLINTDIIKFSQMKNKGLKRYRWLHGDNQLERKFAEKWEDLNIEKVGKINGILDHQLAKDSNRPCGEVTDRDREVAATVIQWLGSLVGQDFLRSIEEE